MAVSSGDTFVTSTASQALYVIGQDAFLQRENSAVSFSGAVVDVLRILSGKLLSVFAKGSKKIETVTATIGIHGTGCYIEAEDRSGLERLLRYCARPVFALERLRQIDPEHLVYESIKPGPSGSISLLLTPLELIERLAALIPPPRRHRHRYYDQRKSLWDGVLAPNAPLRAVVSALAVAKDVVPVASVMTEAVSAPELGAIIQNAPDEETEEPALRRAARYVWALLLARIYEVLPLRCPKCGGDMRIIAFINEGPVMRDILGHLGEPTSAPRLAPARGSPLWELPVDD